MIILNTTFYVHESIDGEFRRWIECEYFPSASAHGGLEQPVMAKILMEPQEGMNGYAVQCLAPDIAKAQSWHDSHAAELRGALSAKFGQKVLFFTTYMERIWP
ncbi:MAG: DUF4286 family protein [Duncaniella sp.]|nr:DUF4286 family protein [Duncaniella sp.]